MMPITACADCLACSVVHSAKGDGRRPPPPTAHLCPAPLCTLWQYASVLSDAAALPDFIVSTLKGHSGHRLCWCIKYGSQVWGVNCRALGAGEDLKSFDIDTKWGKQALDRLYGDVLGVSDPMPGVQVQ